MTHTRYNQLVAVLITIWFAISFTASALHLFVTVPGTPPLALLLSVLLPLGIFTAWYLRSSNFRSYIQSLSPAAVTLMHSWRTAGYAFLVLAAYNILPNLFALPAGWGDIAMGVTAPFVAYRLANPAHRRSFIFWQLLGVTDLVLAISLGAAAPFLAPNAPTTTPMQMLPLSIIPTFGVPFLLILHIISIAQARQWSEQSSPKYTQQLKPSPAGQL